MDDTVDYSAITPDVLAALTPTATAPAAQASATSGFNWSGLLSTVAHAVQSGGQAAPAAPAVAPAAKSGFGAMLPVFAIGGALLFLATRAKKRSRG